MIDITVYRFRIGVYNANTIARCFKNINVCNRKRHTGSTGNIFDYHYFYTTQKSFYISVIFFMLYLLSITYFFTISFFMLCSMNTSSAEFSPSIGFSFLSASSPNLAFGLKSLYLIFFLIHIINQFYRKNFGLSGIYEFVRNHMIKIFYISGRLGKGLIIIIMWLYMINLGLVTIVNPSLLNPGPGANLSVYYQNVQGLIPFGDLKDPNPMLDITKKLEINAYLSKLNTDIVILNETWLKKSIVDNEIIPISDYKIYRKDRTAKTHPPDPLNSTKYRANGGGVLIAIRTDLNFTSKEINLNCGAEIIAIEFTMHDGSKFILCTCYRVGTLGIPNHEKVIGALKTLSKRKRLSKLFVIGDFNLRNASWDELESTSPIEQSFVDSFNDLGLVQCINQPTHKDGRILDILLTNSAACIQDLKVLDKDSICRSDHYPVTFNMKIKVSRDKPIKRKFYNFKKANWDGLNAELRYTDWNAMLDCCDAELGWKKFKQKLFELANKHIPKASMKSDAQPPWFDSECYDLCRKKNHLRTKFKKSKNESDGIKFSLARKEFKKLVSQKMRDNLCESEDDSVISKKIWSYVKATSNNQRIPEFITYNNHTRCCPVPLDQAELFNEFFYEQFSEASNYNIPIDFTEDNRFDIDFNHTRVRKILTKINSNKAHGPDGIHGKLLKNCAVGLAYPLSLIFKISYNTGGIPNDWKLANVVPIFKKGNKHDASNYRPISLTSLVMKTFERIIKEELLHHVNEFIDPRQHGFLAKKSCTTNLIGLCDSLALSLNENIQTDIIYFDFAKAFDSVNHDIILYKLKTLYNIDGRLLKFVMNYLKDRQQRVIIGNKFSSLKCAKSGVPQGSILGPLLFVLFINDIPDGLSKGTDLSLYADDTKIWRMIMCENDNICLQNDIDYLHDWSVRNKIRFHPNKCKVLSVATTYPQFFGALPFTLYIYSLGENPLDYVERETDLGVEITPNLNWSDQCCKVYSRANQKLGLMRRTCHFVYDHHRRRVLYLALVRSQFEHCSVIWRPQTETKISRLEAIQKRALKWILSEESISYSSFTTYIQKCRQANILPLRTRFDLLDLLFFYKVVYKLTPVSLPFYLSPYLGNTRLRNTHLDYFCFVSTLVPKSSSGALAQGFFYRTHSKWNNIPLEIRKLGTLSKFKDELTDYMWKHVLESVNDNDDSYFPENPD